MDTTVLTILGSFLAIGMFVIGLLSLLNNKQKVNDNQAVKIAELNVKLTNIEKQLTEIQTMILTSNDKCALLEKRVFVLEQRMLKKKHNEA
jgi:hypothetical protein